MDKKILIIVLLLSSHLAYAEVVGHVTIENLADCLDSTTGLFDDIDDDWFNCGIGVASATNPTCDPYGSKIQETNCNYPGSTQGTPLLACQCIHDASVTSVVDTGNKQASRGCPVYACIVGAPPIDLTLDLDNDGAITMSDVQQAPIEFMNRNIDTVKIFEIIEALP